MTFPRTYFARMLLLGPSYSPLIFLVPELSCKKLNSKLHIPEFLYPPKPHQDSFLAPGFSPRNCLPVPKILKFHGVKSALAKPQNIITTRPVRPSSLKMPRDPVTFENKCALFSPPSPKIFQSDKEFWSRKIPGNVPK